MIIADDREIKCIGLLKKDNYTDVVVSHLEVGDFLLPDDFVIERKLGRDFMASVASGRLYTQLNNMYQYKNLVLVIVVDNKWKDFYFTKSRYVHKQYMGTLTTLVAKYPKLRIVQLENDDEFISFLKGLHKKLTEDGHKERPAIKLRKTKKIQQVKENCLAQIEGVGIPLSKKLLHEFGSINNVSNCSEKDLVKIEKLGKKTAENILKTLN